MQPHDLQKILPHHALSVIQQLATHPPDHLLSSSFLEVWTVEICALMRTHDLEWLMEPVTKTKVFFEPDHDTVKQENQRIE